MKVPSSSWVDPTAVLEGEVRIGKGCFVSAGAMLRGEVTLGDGVFIGERTGSAVKVSNNTPSR